MALQRLLAQGRQIECLCIRVTVSPRQRSPPLLRSHCMNSLYCMNSLCCVFRVISTYMSFHRSVHIYIYIYTYMYTYIYTYMCMAVYICIHIFKGHGFTEAKIPTIVASAVCCFCRVQRLLWRGFPLLRSHCMNHSCCLFRMQRATSLILCDTTYLIIYLPPLYRHPCGTERYSFGCVVLPLFWAPIIVCFFILDCFFVPNKCP